MLSLIRKLELRLYARFSLLKSRIYFFVQARVSNEKKALRHYLSFHRMRKKSFSTTAVF